MRIQRIADFNRISKDDDKPSKEDIVEVEDLDGLDLSQPAADEDPEDEDKDSKKESRLRRRAGRRKVAETEVDQSLVSAGWEVLNDSIGSGISGYEYTNADGSYVTILKRSGDGLGWYWLDSAMDQGSYFDSPAAAAADAGAKSIVRTARRNKSAATWIPNASPSFIGSQMDILDTVHGEVFVYADPEDETIYYIEPQFGADGPQILDECTLPEAKQYAEQRYAKVARRKKAYKAGDVFTIDGTDYVRQDGDAWQSNSGDGITYTDDEVKEYVDGQEGSVKTSRRKSAADNGWKEVDPNSGRMLASIGALFYKRFSDSGMNLDGSSIDGSLVYIIEEGGAYSWVEDMQGQSGFSSPEEAMADADAKFGGRTASRRKSAGNNAVEGDVVRLTMGGIGRVVEIVTSPEGYPFFLLEGGDGSQKLVAGDSFDLVDPETPLTSVARRRKSAATWNDGTVNGTASSEAVVGDIMLDVEEGEMGSGTFYWYVMTLEDGTELASGTASSLEEGKAAAEQVIDSSTLTARKARRTARRKTAADWSSYTDMFGKDAYDATGENGANASVYFDNNTQSWCWDEDNGDTVSGFGSAEEAKAAAERDAVCLNGGTLNGDMDRPDGYHFARRQAGKQGRRPFVRNAYEVNDVSDFPWYGVVDSLINFLDGYVVSGGSGLDALISRLDGPTLSNPEAVAYTVRNWMAENPSLDESAKNLIEGQLAQLGSYTAKKASWKGGQI